MFWNKPNSETPISRENQDSYPEWYQKNRLPKNNEIANQEKMPTEEEEKKLRQLFFTEFKPKIINFLVNIKIPDGHKVRITENQVSLITAFLYGIYFYNLLSKNSLLSPEINMQQNEKKSLDINDLNDWPLEFTTSTDQESLASVNLKKRTIGVHLEKVPNVDTKKKRIFKYRQTKKGFFSNSEKYTATTEERIILAGIEEAQLLHFYHLREKRKHNQDSPQEKFIGGSQVVTQGPLETYGDLAQLTETGDDVNKLLDYNALIGHEFAAHVVKAEYVKKYLPSVWKNGYEAYDTTIKARRKAVANSKS